MTAAITDWKGLSKKDAEREIASWQSMSEQEFDELRQNWKDTLPAALDDKYRSLRAELVRAYNGAIEHVRSMSSKKGTLYRVDMLLGIQIYQILNRYGLTPRVASYDPVWMYISLRVMPDIIVNRWIRPKKGLVSIADHFYKKARRIYPKSLWWYIYLSLQTNEDGSADYEETYRILVNNTTDDILNLVERSGPHGYRVEVYRELMRQYGINRLEYGPDIIRKIMVLNVARVHLIEPELHAGGIRGYVADLFEDINV